MDTKTRCTIALSLFYSPLTIQNTNNTFLMCAIDVYDDLWTAYDVNWNFCFYSEKERNITSPNCVNWHDKNRYRGFVLSLTTPILKLVFYFGKDTGGPGF